MGRKNERKMRETNRENARENRDRRREGDRWSETDINGDQKTRQTEISDRDSNTQKTGAGDGF